MDYLDVAMRRMSHNRVMAMGALPMCGRMVVFTIPRLTFASWRQASNKASWQRSKSSTCCSMKRSLFFVWWRVSGSDVVMGLMEVMEG